MSEQHTHEPWLDWPLAAYGKIIRGNDSTSEDQVAEVCGPKMAQHIVTCVNACSRFSKEELLGADLWQRAHNQSNEIITLTKQRDELLAALYRSLGYLKTADSLASESFHKEIADIESAITSVKGGRSKLNLVACINSSYAAALDTSPLDIVTDPKKGGAA